MVISLSMQEFLSLYSKIQNPTFEMVLFTFLMAFLCASSIALTYSKTSPSTFRTPSFVQSLILSSVIATMIVQSIGDNVGAGLGMIGALTIINFRTSFRDPRDIVFMFAALGSGIACGSYVFLIAATGTLGFCFIAFALRFTPFHQGNHLVWELRVRLAHGDSETDKLEQILEDFCKKWDLEVLRNSDGGREGTAFTERDYVLIFKNDQKHFALLDTLREQGIVVRKFNKQNSDFTANEV